MYNNKDVIYIYDGSYNGMLCCVFHAVYNKETPFQISSYADMQPSLLDTLYIETNPQKAERVVSAIEEKVSSRAIWTVDTLFLCDAIADKELLALEFIRLAFKTGPTICSMLGNETVSKVSHAIKHLQREAHNYTGFLRFSDFDNSLVSEIEPLNFVLPLLKPHFTSRFRNETFLIYDKTHKSALAYQAGNCSIFALESLVVPEVSACENEIRVLYKKFFDTIAIKERTNYKCQVGHMPKRYWNTMLEVNNSIV